MMMIKDFNVSTSDKWLTGKYKKFEHDIDCAYD